MEERLNDAPGGYYFDENGQPQPSLYHGWVHVWLIYLGEMALRYFRVEESRVEERLAQWGDTGLECRISKAAPAHTIVLFAYEKNSPITQAACAGGVCNLIEEI